MNLRSSILSLPLLAAPLLAQVPDAREVASPAGYGWYYGVTEATLANATNAGFRITDIEVDSVAPLRFNACLIRNSGSNLTGWWWYHGLTAAQVSNNLSTNSARLIDLEPYDDGNGNTRFACVMVSNTGVNQKGWAWYYGITAAQVTSYLSQNGGRPVDIDRYEIGGTTRYSVVMINNTGADQRAYTVLYDRPFADISAAVSNTGRRPYDLERNPDGTWSAILIDDVGTTPFYGWWVGIDAATVAYNIGQYGLRPIDIECYEVGGQRRFAVLMLNNNNALSYEVGQQMRATTDGQVGCYLRRLGGSELAGLNEGTVFEPASTMKTLHHAHAMRQVRLGNVSLNTMLTVNTNYSSPTSSCPIDTGAVQEPLTTVLRLMMENSDNARTQAVRAFFGQAAINATGTALGMTETELRHRIGCGGDALANPNDITLHDLGLLHEEVAGGWLGSWRDEFYDHMSNSRAWGGISSIVDQEAASLGMSAPAISAFKALITVASKGGSYTLSGDEYRSGFGYVQVPYLTAGRVLAPREYVVGAFVAKASNGTNASNAVSAAIGEMLRDELRAALATWDVTAVAAAYGGNCGGMNQTVSAAPRIGTTVQYQMTGGFPWQLNLLAIGFSDTQNQGVALPLHLAPYGGLPGCFALCSAEAIETGVADGAGTESTSLSFPNGYWLLGTEFFTQFWSLDSQIKTSRGMRSVLGS